jgi:hypothetical protein
MMASAVRVLRELEEPLGVVSGLESAGAVAARSPSSRATRHRVSRGAGARKAVPGRRPR